MKDGISSAVARTIGNPGAWDSLHFSLGPGVFGKKVSQYAATNSREAFAESFSVWSHPGYKTLKKKLPPAIEEFFNTTFKES